MILVDTSVWIAHLRKHNQKLDDLLGFETIYCHPLIIGELACGNLKDRARIFGLLDELPQAPIVTHEEAMGFIEQHRLMGLGLSFIDIHLLAAASLANLSIFTHDKALQQSARHLGFLYH